jgi:hypothetical protein
MNNKYLGKFEMWCWRKMVKISRTDSVTNEVLYGLKEDRNSLSTIKKKKG